MKQVLPPNPRIFPLARRFRGQKKKNMETPSDTTPVKAEDPRDLPQIEVLDKSKQPVAPDQFDEKYRTTQTEIWAYYACV